MNGPTKKTIAETLHMKIQTPWIWLVVVLTICLTALFYVSQKPQVAVYSQYVKSLCDYQFADASLMRSMERVRSGYEVDSAVVLAQMMTLREVALSFEAGIQKLEQSGFSAPPAASVLQFKSSVLAKVSCLQRYLSERTLWHEDLERVYRLMEMNSSDIDLSLLRKLDSARAGYDVLLDDLVLPESINKRVVSLLEKNRNLHNVWNQFDNDKTLSVSDELLHFFQMEYVKEISLSAKVPLAFYFLSLVLLLATFFFIFKSNKD